MSPGVPQGLKLGMKVDLRGVLAAGGLALAVGVTLGFAAPLCAAQPAAARSAAAQSDCATSASSACFVDFTPPGAAGPLHYYTSRAPGEAGAGGPAPTRVLIALHGHSHDANKTFDAALLAARRANAMDGLLVVAPLFQVGARAAARCETAGVPAAQPRDLRWTCSSWIGGDAAEGAALTSFAAMDALIEQLMRQWPSLREVTLAGFSAGGQFVQHYIGFAAPTPAGIKRRYVVADPGSWLYFDPEREPAVDPASCPDVNRWKYGLDGLPAALGVDGATARGRYAAADIHYLEGALDSGPGRGTATRVLDQSCAAQAQGPYRLQRGVAYAAYDRVRLAPAKQRQVNVVPGCAHDVACVFPSDAARTALFGAP